MELQFDKFICKSLHKILSHVLDQELTQEIRLPESLPDIGRVLGSWGQVVLRSKEWYSSSIGVSGGVMTWVLYAPEDGAEPRSVETWIPFQMKWDIPDTQRDGSICVIPLIKSIDARSISARKIMMRTNVSILGEAYEPKETPVYQAFQLPEDIQVLKQTYPVEIPVEAGEKPLQIEEELAIPANAPKIETVCYYDLKPQITESRILGDKLLFRGKANLHVVYLGSDSALQTLEQELSFSQYTHLDNEYSISASPWTCPVVTGLELDLTAEQPMVKANLSVQYIVYDRKLLEITEDAYSTTREVTPEKQILQLFSRLDLAEKNMELSQKFSVQARQIMDAVWYPSHPVKIQNGETLEVEQPGMFQVLYLDMDGNLQGYTAPAKETWEISSDPQNRVDLYSVCTTKPIAMPSGEDITVTTSMLLQAMVTNENGLQMTSGIETGEMKEKDPARPSLIVRKIGKNRIWDIAKQHNANVSDIQGVNGDCEELKEDQVILIPIS